MPVQHAATPLAAVRLPSAELPATQSRLRYGGMWGGTGRYGERQSYPQSRLSLAGWWSFSRWGGQCLTRHLPTSPHISPHLPISPISRWGGQYLTRYLRWEGGEGHDPAASWREMARDHARSGEIRRGPRPGGAVPASGARLRGERRAMAEAGAPAEGAGGGGAAPSRLRARPARLWHEREAGLVVHAVRVGGAGTGCTRPDTLRQRAAPSLA